MDYSVYRASYKTVKGTWRDYLGYTPALDLRLWSVAKCSSFGALFAQAKATPGSLLSKHLRGLDFTPAAKCFCGERVYRGGHVERLKKQKSGYRSRKSQLERGVLKKPSARLERLRRGTNPKKRRAEEQKKRGPRPRSER